MSSLTLYNACVPVLDRLLANLEYVLKKGEENAAERGIDKQVFLDARLAPDMLPLSRQIHIAASMAKNCPHRIAGTTPPDYDGSEATFEELYCLIAKARKDITAFTPVQLNGKEDRAFSVPMGASEREFTGMSYLFGFIFPNVIFHCTTTYNILRHNGVPLGKLDFFGAGGKQ